MSPRATSKPVKAGDGPHRPASIPLTRDQLVQALSTVMVGLIGLNVLPWPVVALWLSVVLVAVLAENRAWRLAAGAKAAPWTRARALALRLVVACLYAAAAYALVTLGAGGERLFALALVSASMVNVLMRHYRSQVILLVSLTPYLIVLGLSGLGAAEEALQHGRLLDALAAPFAIVLLAVQFWSARAQLSGAWMELMTARETAEGRERAAASANRAKSQFLANMSHELRTPLNGVMGMTQALVAEGLSPVQQERVGVIRRSSQNLLSALDDLLDLSKVEASALELEEVEFDLEHLIRGVAAAYRSPATRKGLNFEFEVAEPVRGRYVGDAARIRRILYGLVDNAVKFTSTGGVALEVDRGPRGVVFRVVDTGIGIGSDDLAHLFESFFQADASFTRRYGGAGIGLTISNQFTQLMGGWLDAASQPGEGSTFTLTLPLKPAEPVVAIAAGAPAQIGQPCELRVLAAEDNVTNQLVLKTLLAPMGIAPTLVVNGKEALAAWEQQSWDIVLMDIQMPEMNGIEAARAIRLREQETGRGRTPIVAVTANAMTHQVVEYVAAGMDGVVPKPLDMANLVNAMELAMAQRGETAGKAEGGRSAA